MPSAHVTLVGRRLEHNENLGLCYLRAALEQAGARVTVLYLNDASDLARAAQRVLLDRPDVLGLALADGGSATLPLALGEAVERAGYRGHVTAGGQFATLARQWLLARYGWLDSVVRFAGERPIVAIAERVLRGQDVLGIAGVTTRRGDGAPADVVDPDAAGAASRPRRAAGRARLPGGSHHCFPRLLGALPVLRARGALHPGATRGHRRRRAVGVPYGARRGWPQASRDRGRSRTRWRRCGTSAVFATSISWTSTCCPTLRRRPSTSSRLGSAPSPSGGIGPFGIGAMMRADRMTPAIVAAFADLGLVRAFVGLEIASDEEGRHFGRRAPGAKRARAVFSAFEAHGVATVGNLMLVHPYSTAESISAGIDLLERVPAGVFEATRMMVYHGTRLMKSMAEEGRLIGNPLRYGYTFEDPAMERFAEIFTRSSRRGVLGLQPGVPDPRRVSGLRAGAPGGGGARLRTLGARIERARRDVNRLYVDAYRRALSLSLAGAGFSRSGRADRRAVAALSGHRAPARSASSTSC